MKNFDELPDGAFVRQSQLLGQVLPFSHATFWRLVGAGKFPAPVNLGKRLTAWRVGAVRAWLHERETQAAGK